MSEFEKQYGEETNTPATYRAGASDYHSLRYVRWLEEHLRTTAEMVDDTEKTLTLAKMSLEEALAIIIDEASRYRINYSLMQVNDKLADIQKAKGGN